jgi:high-affinity iron transporter
MLATLIIVLRELIEAGLIVGIVLAATRGVPRRGRWITGGVAAGFWGACIVALFTGVISEAFEGVGQELFNVAVLLVAVAMLTWHTVWMSSHGRELAQEMKTAGSEVASGNRTLLALAIVVGIAVLREGSEIVLFLYGIAISGQEQPLGMAAGALIGLLLGAGISALMYFGLVRIPLQHFFRVTGIMIALLTAGLLAQAIGFLEQAGIITALTDPLWDSSGLLSQDSLFGKVLHTLVGYMDHPTGAQLIAYVLSLGATFGLTRLVADRKAAVA